MQDNILDSFMSENLDDKEKLWEYFIGNGSDYYIKKWRQFEQKDGPQISINIWGFFFPMLWFANRKMYLYAFLVTIFSSVTSLTRILVQINAPEFISDNIILTAFSFIINLLGAFYGNYIYYRYSIRKIDTIIDETQGAQSLITTLKEKGGTNTFLAVIFYIALVILNASVSAYFGFSLSD